LTPCDRTLLPSADAYYLLRTTARSRTEEMQIQNGLIYDVGMHNGNDTAFYLRQGFKVVAIEADPELASAAMGRFESEVRSGRLTVLNLGIAETKGTATFWICDDKREWNSFNPKVAGRNNSKHHSVEIKTARFGDILDEFGIPTYLKIDIEGCDSLCVRELRGRPIPRFISMESECPGDGDDLTEDECTSTLQLLCGAGYRQFKLIAQTDFSVVPRVVSIGKLVQSAAYGRLRLPVLAGLAKGFTHQEYLRRTHDYDFLPGSSGPWGDGTPGKWVNAKQARERYLRARDRHFKNSSVPKYSFWYDWHATI